MLEERCNSFVHATDYQVNPEKVGVIGFSAGGHLAATLSNCFEKKNPSISDELEKLSARPSLAILSYPVITSGQFRHHGSMVNLLGTETPTNELRAEFSMEEAVHNNTPPTFLWHTADDGPVPVEYTYLNAMALNKHKVPHEVHVYPNGEHGIGLASIFNRRNSHASQWRTAAEKWLYMNDF